MPSNNSVLNQWTNNDVGLKMGRSRFDVVDEQLTTFNSGYWFPVDCKEVLPGDTFEGNVSALVRMLTPAVPVMDNLFLDFAVFYVPCRLCTKGEHDWQNFCGSDQPEAWQTDFVSPNLISQGNTFNIVSSGSGPLHNVSSMSLANYLGLPIGSYDDSSGKSNLYDIPILPFNAVLRVWNEWLRDENLMDSLDLSSWDDRRIQQVTSPLGSTDNSVVKGFLAASKLHDYFTSALPSPQKGPSVIVPVLGQAPVNTSGTNTVTPVGSPVIMADASSGSVPASSSTFVGIGVGSSGNERSQLRGIASSATPGASASGGLKPINLYADLAQATGASVNQIRLSFALQRMEEKLSRGGSRFNELLNALFGVKAPSGLLQMSEYLAGGRVPINITQVLQTSETSSGSPLGTTGAFSNTYDSRVHFKKSFVEHGFLLVMATVRPVQSYNQGIPKMFRRLEFTDYYQPTFAFLGEQPIYKEEIYYDTTTQLANAHGLVSQPPVFGYKPAWEEYRTSVKYVTGNFDSASGDLTLSSWTFNSKFKEPPTLSAGYMYQPSEQVGKVLADTKTKTQFIGDFAVNLTLSRPMPVHPYPGLVDHF